MDRKIVKNVDFPDIEYFDGGMRMIGKSIPQDAVDFYDPILREIKGIVENRRDFTFDFKFSYLNTMSIKYISNILVMLLELSKYSKVVINWHHLDIDEDIYELGLEYKEVLKRTAIKEKGVIFNMDYNLIKYSSKI